MLASFNEVRFYLWPLFAVAAFLFTLIAIPIGCLLNWMHCRQSGDRKHGAMRTFLVSDMLVTALLVIGALVSWLKNVMI